MVTLSDDNTEMGESSILILLTCLHLGSVWSAEIYVIEGSVVELICPLQANVTDVSWRGPPNLTIYAVGNDVAMTSFEIKQCSSSSLSILVTNNFTKDKQGHYECYTDKYARSNFTVSIKSNPSELRIINETTENQVVGVEGHAIILECTVKQGHPQGNITWSAEGNVLAINISEHVFHSFIPKRSDNRREFMCLSYNNDGDEVESRRIKLLIYYRPNVTISTEPFRVIQEGQRLNIECLHDGNDPNTKRQWFMNNTKVKGNDSTLLIENVSRTDAGNYTCCVSSRAGTNEETVTIEVYYPPVVMVENRHNGNNRYLLKCVADGNPSSYVFYEWEHLTDRNEHIRFINGSQNGEVSISYNDDDGYYQNSGTYLCNVSNNVPNSSGSIYQTGKISLNIQGRPLFLTSNRPIHYGIYGREGKINIFLHSYPKYESITISCKNITLKRKFEDTNGRYTHTETEVTVQDTIFGSIVQVQAYRIDIEIELLQESDFTNMTIYAKNSKGSATFTFQLMSAHGPESPVNVSAKAYMNSILVSWDRGFDGGYPQTFVIEYRANEVPLSDEWNIYEEINDTINETYSATIEGLEFDRLYVISIYSYNIINKSQIIYTDIRTPFFAEPSYVVNGFVWLGRCSQNSVSSLNRGEGSNDIPPAVESVAASNQLYSSFDRQRGFQVDRHHGFQMVQNVSYAVSGTRDTKSRKQNNRGEESNDIPPEVKSVAASNQLYSSIDRQRGFQVERQRGFQVERQHGFEMDQNVSYAAVSAKNSAKFEMQKNQVFTNEFNGRKDVPELNYTEVSFDPLPKHRQFFIHGEDERTPYADIDLSLKAEALPDSETESSEDEIKIYWNAE